MKVLAYVNLPFDIDLKKEKAYIVLKDGYYIQKVKLMPMPKKKDIDDPSLTYDTVDKYIGFNECIEEIEG